MEETGQNQNQKEKGHLPIEEIRLRLKALGYLESPVERFLSRPAGGPWKTGLLVTIKVSLVVGFLLAGLTTAATLLADPYFIQRTLNVFLFFLYLVAAYALAAFCIVLLPAIFWMHKGKGSMGLAQGGTLRSIVLSAFTTIIICIYLLGWWHVVALDSELVRPLGIISLTILFAIALVSLMAGRLLGFVYFLLAGVPDYPRYRRTLAARSYLISLILVLLIEGAWAIGILRYRAADYSLASILEGYSVHPLPMLLVGIDGFDSESLSRLAESGELPNLSRLLKEGFSARLESQKNYLAPQIWTTISTGANPERHGIDHFTLPVLWGLSRQPRLRGTLPGLDALFSHLFPFSHLVRPVPLSASSRLTKTVWEIIELFKIRTGVVNWWASWPATSSSGFTVSERTFPKIAVIHRDQPIKPTTSTYFFDNEVFPTAEFDSLVMLCDDLTEPFQRVLANYPKISSLLASNLPEEAADLIRSVYFADYFYTRTAIILAHRYQVGFLILYLQGADILSRLEERTELVSSKNLEKVLPEYYRYLDRLLGELLNRFQPLGLVTVVFDPGKKGREHDLKGVVIFKGIDVNPGSKTEQVLPLEDVAPTILYLIGLPVARNMGGKPHLEAGTPSPGGTMPLRYVTSYGPPPPVRDTLFPYRYDQEVIERLRSLGYLK